MATRKRPKIVRALKLLLVFGIFFVFAKRQIDPDFGWHLASGNYHRKHGIPAHDLFSYTARSFEWINHEWGSDALLSWYFSIGGYTLLAAIYAGLWTAAVFISNRKARLGVLLLSVAALLPFAGVRAIAWTALLLAVLLWLCRSKARRARYFVPPLLLVWANLHAGFIVGLAVLGYFTVVNWRRWWPYLLASFAATFINPYGPRLYEEVIRTLFNNSSVRGRIVEWYQVSFPVEVAGFMLLWVVGFWFFRRKTLKNWLSLQSFFAIASLMAVRNIPLFVIVSQAELERHWERLQDVLQTNLKRGAKTLLTLMAVAAVVWSLSVIRVWNLPSYWRRDPAASYPKQAVAYLKAHPCPGNLFNNYDYGGYLIWQLPAQPVYVDGRMPTWLDEQGTTWLDRYYKVLDDTKTQEQEFARYNIRCALLVGAKTEQKLIDNLTRAGWQRVFTKGPVLLIDTGGKPLQGQR